MCEHTVRNIGTQKTTFSARTEIWSVALREKIKDGGGRRAGRPGGSEAESGSEAKEEDQLPGQRQKVFTVSSGKVSFSYKTERAEKNCRANVQSVQFPVRAQSSNSKLPLTK